MSLNTAPNTAERVLTEEIKRVIERNNNEAFLRKLLTRAIILEKVQGCAGRRGGVNANMKL